MDLMAYLGTVGTFIFGILSIFFYFKSKRSKKPVFVYDYSVLQTLSHPEVTILFKQEKISSLSRSHIAFFNAGNREIRSEDVPMSKYPTIEFSEPTRILSYKIVKQSSPEAGIVIKQHSTSSLELSFDFLNPGCGVLVEVLYDAAASNTKPPINFTAPIKGADAAESYRYIGKERGKAYIMSLGMVLVFLLVSLLEFRKYWLSSAEGVIHVLELAQAFVPILPSIYFLNWSRKLPRRKAIPKFAEEFFEKQ